MAVSWSQVAAHRERLLKIARRRCPTREDAEDVVQEAMIRTATFSDLDEARLGQFLTAVTLRLCADVHRSAERGARALRRLETEDVPSPEVAAVAAAEAEELRALLATLPDRQRDVLVDRAEGFSVTQISSRHALTYKATESALSRARAHMRLALASAMGVVAAAFGVVRRRPAVVLALPLAAVAFVTAVHEQPVPYAAPPAATGAPVAVPGVRVAGVASPPEQAAVVRPVRTEAVVARQVAVRAPVTPPKPKYEDVISYDPPGPVKPIAVESDGEPVGEMVERCLNAESYTLEVDPSPDPDKSIVYPRCNP